MSNFARLIKPQDEPQKTETLYGHAAERAVLGHILENPKEAATICSRLSLQDFGDSVHVRCLQEILVLVEQARNPSVEALCAVMNGDDEIEAGLTLRTYLNQIVREGILNRVIPWQDAVEVVLDQSNRRRLDQIARQIASGALGRANLIELASGAIHALDDVLSACRAGKRLAYDATQAVDFAIKHAESNERAYPTTGLNDLDDAIGGWPLGQLTLIGARPGMGKSAFATYTARKMAAAGDGVAMFSLEMTSEQLGARLLTDLAWQHRDPIMYEDILNRRLSDEHGRRIRAIRGQLKDLPFHIEEQRGLTLSEIASRCRKIANQFDRKNQKLRAVIIDHLGLVRSSDRYAGNRVQEISEISDGLATLAKELDIALIALSQLNRAVEGRDNKRPSLADLRDSGSLEQDASCVVFLYRPAYYLENMRFDDEELEAKRVKALEEDQHVLELINAKNRNGRNGIIEAYVNIGANAIRNKSVGY